MPHRVIEFNRVPLGELNRYGNGAGVQKERMLPADMYVLAADGTVLSSPPAKGVPHKPPKCSECCPLFLKVCTLTIHACMHFASLRLVCLIWLLILIGTYI